MILSASLASKMACKLATTDDYNNNASQTLVRYGYGQRSLERARAPGARTKRLVALLRSLCKLRLRCCGSRVDDLASAEEIQESRLLEHASFNSPDCGRVRRCYCHVIVVLVHSEQYLCLVNRSMVSSVSPSLLRSSESSIRRLARRRSVPRGSLDFPTARLLANWLAWLSTSSLQIDLDVVLPTVSSWSGWLCNAHLHLGFRSFDICPCFRRGHEAVCPGVSSRYYDIFPIMLCSGQEADSSRLLPRHTPARLYQLSCVLS